MTMISDARDGLSTLPGEIIEMIAVQCADHVVDLRAACRRLRHETWRTFTDRFFALRNVWIDRTALASLDALTNQRRLTMCIKRLVIHLHRWEEEEIEKSLGIPGLTLSDGSLESFDYAWTQMSEQQLLLRGGEATSLLTTIFCKLSELDSLEITPWARSYDWWLDGASPPESLSHSGLVVHAADAGPFIKSVWPVTIQALCNSGLQVKGLNVTPYFSYQELTVLTPGIAQPLSHSFEDLNELHISMHIPNARTPQALWRRSFLRLLTLCKHIAHLRLRFSVDESLVEHETCPFEMVSKTFTDWPTFPRLVRFGVVIPQTTPEHLVGFLSKHQKTLRELDIRPVRFGGVENWHIVLHHLRDCHELKRLRTTDVCTNGARHIIVAMEDVAYAIDLALRASPKEGFRFTSPSMWTGFGDWSDNE